MLLLLTGAFWASIFSPARSDNPIIFFEHVLLYNVKGEW